MMSPFWWTYRRLRLARAKVTESNRFLSEGGILSWRQEYSSVQGVLKTRGSRISVVKTDEAGRLCYETPLGPFWTPPGADEQYVRMLTQEILSSVYMIGSGTLSSDSVVMDCGANIGFFSRYALRQGAGKVIAFEPAPETAACLRMNLAEEIADGRAIVVEKGLWNEETVLHFSTSSVANPGSNHIVQSGGDIQIPVTSLDSICRQLGVDKVDYIKMDIEGAEVRALEGAAELIKRCQPRCSIATEHTSDLFNNAAQVVEVMRQHSPRYRFTTTEFHVTENPSVGRKLTPYCIYFEPATT